MWKIESKFRKWKKKSENIFRFWDNCIWKFCYKLYLVRKEYLLSAVSWLKNSPKILHIPQRDFSTWNAFTGINKFGKGAVVEIWTVIRRGYHVTYPRVLWKRTFRHLSNQVFRTPQVLKFISYEGHLLGNGQIWM